jgi:PAS domain S-box-containing protein
MNRSDETYASLVHEVLALRARNQHLEQELLSLQVHYTSFLDRAPLGLSIVKGFVITYCNAAWRLLFSVPDGSCCIGRSPLDFIATDALPALLAQLVFLPRTRKKVQTIRSTGLRCDGSNFPLQLVITPSQLPHNAGYVTIVQDITAQVQAEEKLQANMARYLAVFNNNSVGISIIDATGAFVEVNDRYARYFGYTPDALLSVTPLMLIHPDERTNTQGLLQQLFSKEIMYYTMEKRYLRRDGTCFWGHVFVSPILDTEGEVLQAVCLVIDITERKHAEQSLAKLNANLERLVQERTQDLTDKALALEKANRTLQKLDDMKTAFLSSVSHELRTPLTSIFGFTKLIHKDFTRHFSQCSIGDAHLEKKSERIVKNLMVIEQEGRRLSRLVNDVLDLHKMESGQMQWSLRTISVAECMYEAILAVGGHFSDNDDVQLVSDIPERLPKIEIDPDRLAQVLINLLHNAVKFTRSGQVILSARATGDGMVQIQVKDSGPGIPDADQPYIFDKFHQVATDDTLGSKPKGTGLGLSICKHIIEQFGGTIWVESTLGKGSSFIFELPAVP